MALPNLSKKLRIFCPQPRQSQTLKIHDAGYRLGTPIFSTDLIFDDGEPKELMTAIAH
jgi:hypothetical protein